MLFSLFFIGTASKALKPLFFLPCLTCSPLYANITDPDRYPECPSPYMRRRLWPIDVTLQSEYPECYGILMDTVLDRKTNTTSPRPGITIYTDDFGNYANLASFKALAKTLTFQHHYEDNVNIFGVTYDWIHYYLGLDYVFNNLTRNIETAVKNNEGKKAILMGQSLGAHFIKYYLKHKVSKEWINQYIDRVIFAGPAFYGCFNPFDEFVRGWFSQLQVTPGVAEAARKMVSCQCLTPNYVIGKDETVFKNAGGKDLKPSDIKQYLIDNGALTGDALDIFNIVEEDLKEEPTDIGVPSLILYNSGFQTQTSFDATNGFEGLKPLLGPGDSTCETYQADYICEHWAQVKCLDFESTDVKYSHLEMIRTPEAIFKIIDFMDFE